MHDSIKMLSKMAARLGPRQTHGLSNADLNRLLPEFPLLQAAISEAFAASEALLKEFPFLTNTTESALIDKLQESFLNFYPMDQRNPYIPVAARGPWIVTLHGAVVHDSGGYGMLGFGHNPGPVLDALSKPQVMANVMTANVSQYRLAESLKVEIGHGRSGGCPYAKFICVNSGSEAMTVALRISDAQTRSILDQQRAAGGSAARRPMFLSIEGGFHGRTERPAMLSSSSSKNYTANLESFRNLQVNYTIPPNDREALLKAFEWAKQNNVFFEVMAIEPVMGEGNPGLAVTPEFYRLARDLTEKNGTFLLVDSIQAGLRTSGVLSLVDFPGFTDLPPPDMESFSKALNGGQFPLSVLALHPRAVPFYRRGTYGNTKTTNPRACDVAVAVLSMVQKKVRSNIVEKGHELLAAFSQLQKDFPSIVTKCQGQGLLCSIEINSDKFKVVGAGQLEEYLRKKGIGVIHGGKNALRFTPHFLITSAEIKLIADYLREAFTNGPILN